jgi:hypothetical protein
MSKIYCCNICVYETKDCSNYKRHIESKKHKTKMQNNENAKILKIKSHDEKSETDNESDKSNKSDKSDKSDKPDRPYKPKKYKRKKDNRINECTFCHKTFSRSDSLNRHADRCLLKEFQRKDTIIEQKESQLQMKNEQIEYYREILDMRGIKDCNVSKFTYISSKYPDVEPVEKLSYGVFKEHHKIRYINNSEKSFNELLVDDILHCFRKETFPEYVAKTISRIFKCKDKSMQKLWVTDPSRLKFMIKTRDENYNDMEYMVNSQNRNNIHNNDYNNNDYIHNNYNHNNNTNYLSEIQDHIGGSFWKIDCGGFVVLEKIIKPILFNMKTRIEEYMDIYCFTNRNKINNLNFRNQDICENMIKKIEDLMELKDNIVCGKYDKKILQCIVPNFIVKNKTIKDM